MFKLSLAVARTFVRNHLTSRQNTPIVWTTAATQIQKNRYASDYKRPPVDSAQQENVDRKRKIAEAEVSYWHANAAEAPDPASIKPEEWEHLSGLGSTSARKKFCRFLFLRNEAKKETRDFKEARKAASMEYRLKVKAEKEQNTHIYYGLGGNALLMRIQRRTVIKWRNKKLIRARLSGPKLVFDCSFDAKMSYEEAKSAGRQLQYCFADNRRHKMPFDIHLCNVNPLGATLKWLQQYIPNVLDKKFLLPIHEKCFTELFPVERLVYLSPDSDNVLTNYNADDIYIVGVIVDKGPCQPLSLGKAKELGVRHARLPLDTHVRLASGAGKRFTLNSMTNILLEWKQTRDWTKAFEYIDRRKVKPEPEPKPKPESESESEPDE